MITTNATEEFYYVRFHQVLNTYRLVSRNILSKDKILLFTSSIFKFDEDLPS